MPRPWPREEQHLEPPSETIKKLEESGKSEGESSSEEELLPAIPQHRQTLGQEAVGEEPLKDPEHNLEIEEFHFKSESSSEDEREPSTVQHLDNKGQQVPNTELIEGPEPEANSEPREEIKPEISERRTPAAESKSKPKWPTLHMYTGEGKDRDPQ
jgi:hypothetical protein